MKKWVFVFFIIIIIILAGGFYWKKSIPQPPNKVLSAIEAPTTAPTPRIWRQSTVLNIDGVTIRISWAQVNPKEVELYSNLKEQKLFEEIRVNKNCQVLVSGGFYSEENTHLGFFVANFETISQPIQSALLNGFLWINSNETVVIDSNPPNIIPRLGLQSGPLLMQNKEPLTLSIKDDETNRRIIAATTNSNQLYFLAFYRDGEDLQGPMLGELPEIINLFKKQTGIDIVDAINLDGGSHSIFITNYDLLREQARVGSYFCIK